MNENSTLFGSSGVTSKLSIKDHIKLCWITFDIGGITFDICHKTFDICCKTFDICCKTFHIDNTSSGTPPSICLSSMQPLRIFLGLVKFFKFTFFFEISFSFSNFLGLVNFFCKFTFFFEITFSFNNFLGLVKFF